MKKVLLFILICLPLCFFGCDKQNVVKLNAPKNLAVENGIVTFERVANEGYYSISINNFEILADINSSRVEIYSLNDINYFAYNAQNLLAVGEQYTIKVQARANGKKSSEVVSVAYSHQAKLAEPTNVGVNGNVLSWNAVENAEIYEIEITSPSAQTSEKTTALNLLDLSDVLTTGGEYTFKVKAKTSSENFLESDFAQVKFENYFSLATPKNLSVDSAAVLSAEIDSHANALMLNINERQKLVERQNSNVQVVGNLWKINLKTLANSVSGLIDFGKLGYYNISLQAVYSTSAKNYYTPSVFCNGVTFVNTKQLRAPNVQIDSQNTFATWSSSELDFISGFKVEIALRDGGPITYIYDKTILSLKLPKNFVSISVTALGKDFYLDSSATTVRR